MRVLLTPGENLKGVFEAIAQEAGIVEVEFLRPPTLSQLVERLENRHLPAIDLIHFDGHGVFEADGAFAAKSNHPDAATKKAGGEMGYLVFEKSSGEKDLVSAEKLGDMLHRQKISAIILSACQSAQMGEEPMGSVAARLTPHRHSYGVSYDSFGFGENGKAAFSGVLPPFNAGRRHRGSIG